MFPEGMEIDQWHEMGYEDSQLNHFQQMFHFYAPENIRKPKVF